MVVAHPSPARRLLARSVVLLAASCAAILVVLACAPGDARAYVVQGRAWPGGEVTYAETLPPSWDWSLSHAIEAWNGSGANVRFVRASAGERPDVRIGFGRVGPAELGFASIGAQRGAYVRVSSTLPRTLPREDWVDMGRLLGHELGHVLGLGHGPDAGCELMDAKLVEDGCPGAPRVGWYRCRWVFPDDARGAVRLYGGRPRLHALTCPIEPAPPQLTGLAVTGGAAAGAPVRLSWNRARGNPPGATYEVGVYLAGRCGDATARLQYATLARTATSWTQPEESGATGERCYQVQVVNRWGWGPAAQRRTATSWSPAPTAPTGISLVERPLAGWDYRVTATIDPDAYLWAMVGASGACPATFELATALTAEAEAGGTFLLRGVPTGASCISFFALDGSSRVSPPTSVEVVHA